MSSDLGPGTPLIFVGPEDPLIPSGLTIDALYFVQDVRDDPMRLFLGCRPLLSLKGKSGRHDFYCACMFKPLCDGEPLNEEEDTGIYNKELVN